jgi:hypothetical protein
MRKHFINDSKAQLAAAMRIVNSDNPVAQARIELGKHTYRSRGREYNLYTYPDLRKVVTRAKKIARCGKPYFVNDGTVFCASLTTGNRPYYPAFGRSPYPRQIHLPG